MFSEKSHADAVRRTFVPFVSALTLVAALGLGGVPGEARAATQQECINEFNESDASDSCEMSSASASGDNCTFSGLCQSGSSWISTSITTALGNVDGLQNCSGSLAASC